MIPYRVMARFSGRKKIRYCVVRVADGAIVFVTKSRRECENHAYYLCRGLQP